MVELINEHLTDQEFDLAVIGGGMIGMCTAWYAAQQFPQWRIAVFEQNEVGSGASHYSVSLDMPYGHTALRHQLATRSGELYRALRNTLPLPIKDLSFYGIVDSNSADDVVANFTGGSSCVSSNRTAAVADKYAGLIIPNGKVLVTGIASYATENKIAKILAGNFSDHHHLVFEHTAVQAVESRNRQYGLVTKTGKQFSAKRVVQATGPWLDRIYKNGNQPSQVVRVKKVVAFHLWKQPEPDDPLFYFFDDDAFLLPKYEAGYWLFSFKCDHWDVLPDISKLHIDKADETKARYILKKYYPLLESLCTNGRVFCDAYTENSDPFIEPLCREANYIFAGACSGSGYRLAPAIAEQVIQHFIESV